MSEYSYRPSGARFVLGIDQSTSGTTAVLLDEEGNTAARTHRPVSRFVPRPGWVEQDPMEIWTATSSAIHAVIHEAHILPEDVEAIGIANQRETTVAWDRHTGEPIGRAITWQDRRTASFCADTGAALRARLEQETGFTLVPNAAGPKIRWLLKNDPRVQRAAAKGDLLWGTVDAWLIWNLTGKTTHITDHSNASVTMMMAALTLTYSELALDYFDIPRSILPSLVTSSEVYGETHPDAFLGARVPIAGCIGDQQAALLGQGCLSSGMTKNTYGSGSFMIMNTGDLYVPPTEKIFSPVAWSAEAKVTYSLEGMSDESGGVLDWLRDGLGIIQRPEEAETLARQVPDTRGLHFVPTLADPEAFPDQAPSQGGILMGLTQSCTRQHIARAALEAIAFQARDLFEAIARAGKQRPQILRVDGGGAQNDFLMQFQADILGIPLERPAHLDTIPRGAAFLAGVAVGYWESLADATGTWQRQRLFEPTFSEDRRESCYAGWSEALAFTQSLDGR